jgi:hypothetical protein
MHPPAAPLRVRGRMVIEGCNQSKGGRPRPAAFGRKRSFALGKKRRDADGKLLRQPGFHFLYLKKNGRIPGPFFIFFLDLFF